MATKELKPELNPQVRVTGVLLDNLDSSVRDAQRKFTDLIFNIASLRAKYEDLQRRFAENPTKEEYDALLREKDEWEKEAKKLQEIVNDTNGIISGDLKGYTEAEYLNALALRDEAIRERDAALRGSAIRDLTLRDDYGDAIMEVRVTN